MTGRQASLLLVGWDGGGAVQPFLGLGRRLAARGHRVDLMGTATLGDRVRRAGLPFHPFRRATSWSPEPGQPIERNLPAFTLHLLGPEMAYDTMDAIERLHPDTVVIDHMAVGALCGAERTGAATAVLVHNLYRPWLDGDYAAEWARGRFIVNGGRAKIGLDALDGPGSYHTELWSRADLVLVNCPAQLDEPPEPLPKNTHYVGPIFADPRAPAAGAPVPEPNRTPLVLVSLSSTYMAQESLAQRVLDAFEGLGARAVVTLGEGLDPAGFRAPPGVTVERFVPHARLLPSVDAVVSHGGLLTVQDALAHGVPVVCLPGGRDNYQNAARAQACGAGIALDAEAEPSRIREAIGEVLAEPGYARAARDMAGHIAECADGARAVARIERLAAAATRARSPRS